MPVAVAMRFNSVCILRLSAIGDTCHALALLRALQAAWPHARFTWIIGTVEARLMSVIAPEVEFITFHKRATLRELLRLRHSLRARRFDVLLDLQLSMRASLVSTLVQAPVKLGFDRRRARELQWCFTNAQVAPRVNEHVLDSFMGFARACGVEPGPPRWAPELPKGALDYAAGIITDAQPTILISPCSSHVLRNWSAQRYAAVADYAAEQLGLRVVLVGGRSAVEADTAAAIKSAMRTRALDQVGQDTLPQLLGLMSKATVLLTPDSGPAHMAAMVGLPVLGLYAATNPARAGPYLSREWCVDRYDAAARRYLRKPAAAIPWTTKIERPGVMDLIEVSAVSERLEALMARQRMR